jgi:16S rRNA processing protein RimM
VTSGDHSHVSQNGRDVGHPKGSAKPGGDFITLARVVKTQGRRGEVAVEIHSDVPDRFTEGMKLFALLVADSASEEPVRAAKAERGSGNDVRRELEIEDLWPHKGLLVLKFRGVDSISDARQLIGSELQVPRAERAELEPGWTYVSDLVGCTVFDHRRAIGRIEDVQFGAGEAPLLIVADDRDGGAVKKYDVPFAEAYLESVDAARRQVRMRLPEGMLEINVPVTPEEKEQQRSIRHEARGGRAARRAKIPLRELRPRR